ncbi:unnamed protein product [Phytophthora fragariaefolia]|uniref:Unnamed protein product n=1 Tax=Phytophthora fragariaefolia TaxID=1490495 RepID=A0A9W6TRR2_9STRA|nr:unnamed protein product [Phytophthora fragariaefolia]
MLLSQQVEISSDIEACVKEESASGGDGTVEDAGVVQEEGAVAQRCRSKMEFRIATVGYPTVRMHTSAETVVASSVMNVESEMKVQADFIAIEHVAWPNCRVWEELRERFYSRYAIPENGCLISMTPGVLDTLTVLNHAKVKGGMNLVRREIKQRCRTADVVYSVEKLGVFWSYFERTWLEQYSIEIWNVFGLDNELAVRTNNPLERFDRELNSRFPTPHPSMATFVTVIKTNAQEYVRRAADVPRGRARRIPREVIQLPDAIDIPSDIESDVEEANTADAGTVIIV